MRRALVILATAAAAIAASALAAPAAQAADRPVPSSDVCAEVAGGATYACMSTAKRAVPSGDPVIFTGTLSAKARKSLAAWTKGDNIVCLTRYPWQPSADGWGSTPLEGACTTVRKDGGFTIDAELGRKGRFFYGLEMGPCRADEALCGGGDPLLVGLYNKGDKAIALRTT